MSTKQWRDVEVAVDAKKKENEQIERAYKDTLKKTTREQPVKKADPWGGAAPGR